MPKDSNNSVGKRTLNQGLQPNTPVQFIKGIGPKLAEAFLRRDIQIVEDLLTLYPRVYENRRAATKFADVQEGEMVSLHAQIVRVRGIPVQRGRRTIYDVTLKDSSGLFHCKFFRVPFRGYFDRFQTEQEVRVIGKLIVYKGQREFHHPDLRTIDQNEELRDEITPIYPDMDPVTPAKLRDLIKTAMLEVQEKPERIPPAIINKLNLLSQREALKDVHWPRRETYDRLLQFRAPGQVRIIFEEFFWLQSLFAAQKQKLVRLRGSVIPIENKNSIHFQSRLPFELTQGQKDVITEIERDLAALHPMNRLLQGDVGSGKTIVAFAVIDHVAIAGLQSCLMAPTEILAEQHFAQAKKYFGEGAEILTGRTKARDRKIILDRLERGEIKLLIGTHALIEDPVRFQNLALVVIDEQHRFGVRQRAKLLEKGKRPPHVLIMTATPIPRTLAMTVHGDLQVSSIRELPKGRAPIQTRVTFANKRAEVFQFVEAQIKKGRQAYVICPLVEESETIDMKNAVDEYERIASEHPDIRAGLLHGRMSSEEKENVMQKFRARDIDLLVSTTVVEVGVDVPNANIIVIQNSERFGLSQLHQLRGRVGRGEHKSFCILMMGFATSEEAMDRTRFMETTTDGFRIAEFDLEMRGPGEFIGTRQSGINEFKMANLFRDQPILELAQQAAEMIFDKDPELKMSQHVLFREQLLEIMQAAVMT